MSLLSSILAVGTDSAVARADAAWVGDAISSPAPTLSPWRAAVVQRVIKEAIGDTKISGEAVDLVVSLASEFVQMVASQTTELCNKGNKKMITGEHVLKCVARWPSPFPL